MKMRKKHVLPVLLLAVGVISFVGFSGIDKTPEEKAHSVDKSVIVKTSLVRVEPHTLKVNSHGWVLPKEKTKLAAQVSGKVVYISPEFVKGGFVKKGQVIAKIDATDYETALVEAESSIAVAKSLVKTEMAQSKAAELDWQKMSDATPTDLSLRKPQLASEISKLKYAQSMLVKARVNLKRTEIRAPYDAIISERFIGLGSHLVVGREVADLSGISVAEVRLPVTHFELGLLTEEGIGTSVQLTNGGPKHSKQWSAIVVRSEGIVDGASRMIHLVAEVKDPYEFTSNSEKKSPLRFGTYVNAIIDGKLLTSVASLPVDLLIDNKMPILNEESKLELLVADIVQRNGKQLIVRGAGLNGKKLVTTALEYPYEGMLLSEEIHDDEQETELVSVSHGEEE